MRKAAGFVKRPPGTRAFGLTGPDQAGHRTSVQDLSGGKRDESPRTATGRTGTSVHGPSGRTGLRPGSCEPAGPRISVHGLPGRTEASAKDPASQAGSDFGPGGAVTGTGSQIPLCQAANRQGLGPDGEPAGNLRKASAFAGPRSRITEPPVRPGLETARAESLASQAR